MTIRRLCVNEVTTISRTFSQTVTCTDPAHTPVVGAGDECSIALYNVSINLGTTPPTLSFSFDSQFEYQYLHAGVTFQDYCNVLGSSGSVTLPTGVTLCCGGTMPTVASSASCNAGAITTTSTSVSGPVTLAFTVTDLCSQTVICVDDTICP
jgi:hypothetical protein